MNQREADELTGSGSYYVHQSMAESITGLQTPPSMSPLSNPSMRFQSNAGEGLTVPIVPYDTSSTMSPHGVSAGPSSAMAPGEPVRRRRGRPRKYGHGSAVSFGLQPPMSSPVPLVRPTQKRRGSTPGSSRKQELSSLGGSLLDGAGPMTPHIINVAVGEDIKRKMLSLLQGRGAVVILSGTGSISAANIRNSSSGGITYEGRFDMLHLSGSYINDIDSPHGPTGSLNVTLAGPDGRVIGGPVEGFLVAASPIQVIVGSLSPRASEPKIKAADDPDLDPRTGRSSVNLANVQHSQNLSPTGAWPSSRWRDV